MFPGKRTMLSVTTAFIMLVSTPVLVLAQEQNVKTDSTSQKSGTEKNGFLEIYGSRGFTYPFGEISGNGGQKTHIADSKAAGINTGYYFTKKHICYLGLTSLTQNFEVERRYMTQLMLTSVEVEYINIDLSYRFQGQWYYAGAGIYMGIPSGTWSRKDALNGLVTENLLYGDLESCAKITAGLNLLCGLTYSINEDYSLNIGLKILVPVIPAYKHKQDSIYILDTQIYASVSHKFNIPFID